MQDAGQDLDRCRLSCPVRSDKRDRLTLRNPQMDSTYGRDFRDRSTKSTPTGDHEILFEVVDLHSAVHIRLQQGKKHSGAAIPDRLIFLGIGFGSGRAAPAFSESFPAGDEDAYGDPHRWER